MSSKDASAMVEQADNPYASPSSSPDSPPVPATCGTLWEFEAGRVLVRDGSVLPDLCILGGPEDSPGQRVVLTLRWIPSWRLPPKPIRITVFQSDQAAEAERRRSRLLRFSLLVPAWGFLIASCLLPLVASALSPMAGSKMPSMAGSWMLAIAAIFIGLVHALQSSRGIRIRSTADGWYELRGLHPEVIVRLGIIAAGSRSDSP